MVLHTKMWLSGVALSGILFAVSLPTVTVAAQPDLIHMRIQISKVSTGTYAKVVHQDLKWLPKDAPVIKAEEIKQTVVAADTNKSVPVQTQTVDKKTTEVKQPTKVAVQVPTETASRGDTDTAGIVSHALSLQGIPYVFGGTSRNGFDCSGYSKYVFAGSGITLPRTSFAQFQTGKSVSRDQLQPGDLVFFTTYSKGASHVGIYIGGGRFVHASDSGVRITSLSEQYYASRYLGARRVP